MYKNVSIAKVTVITVVCLLGIMALAYLNSFEYQGDKFFDNVYGEHTIISPSDINGNMLQAAYDHNVTVSNWRIAEYGIDDNGWKLDFPTNYEVIPVCEKIANDSPVSGTVDMPE